MNADAHRCRSFLLHLFPEKLVFLFACNHSDCCFLARRLLSTINPRHEWAVRLRWGIGKDFGCGATLQEVGLAIPPGPAISRGRVHQILDAAYLKMRRQRIEWPNGQ